MENKTKICKHCQSEIPKKAKICPQCRKRVKGGFMKWIVIALVVIIAVSAMGGGDTADDTPTKVGTVEQDQNESQTKAAENDPVQTEYCVGDILMDGDLKIVYMASGIYEEDNEFSQPEDGYNYIYLKFAFENKSENIDHSVSFYNFECYADGYASEMYYGGDEDLSATLSAGRATTGCVFFAIPQDAETVEVEYTTNYFTEDKIKFLYEGEKDSGYEPERNNSATQGAYAVGDVVESSQLCITYLACEEFTSDNQFIQPRDGYKYISCEFEFENLGESDEFISSWDFDCYADGISCEGFYYLDDDLSATISAGRKAKGKVAFEVPEDAEVIEVEYLSNYWTSNRVVFAVE